MDGVAEESLRFSADEIARIENPGSDERYMVIPIGLICFSQRCCSYFILIMYLYQVVQIN